MSPSLALSNLIYLLLLAVISARAITSQDPAAPAAFDIKRLSTPLKNLLPAEKAISLAGTPSGPNGIVLNQTKEDGTIEFQASINIPGLVPSIYFEVKGNIDDADGLVTVQFWLHAAFDRRIGLFHGNLIQGVDMTPSASNKVIQGESALFVGSSGEYLVLVFEARSGSIHIPQGPSMTFPAFSKALKRWRVGVPDSLEDVPNSSGVQTLSSNVRMEK